MTRSQKLKRYAQPKSLPQRGQRLISISFIYISALARLLTWEKALYYVAALTHSTKPPVCWVWEPSEDSSWIAERSRRSIWFSNVKTKIKKDETRTRCSLVIRSPLFSSILSCTTTCTYTQPPCCRLHFVCWIIRQIFRKCPKKKLGFLRWSKKALRYPVTIAQFSSGKAEVKFLHF